eukprot:CAMPEP_0197855088 /NCGR_PEP_ID=MMETSP1438-20131217/25952_1 /TAXON_ID=1461541 /ORGANISM="Pterosperma sp., Strain CCMP1384" /LENGTH=158 /DNA_ID=CAMNT_0043470067 /DNA_START=174 /DNA_END=650 /DNA_ORIENTATION=+
MVAVVLDNFVGSAASEDLLSQETMLDTFKRKVLLDTFVQKIKEKVLIYRALCEANGVRDPNQCKQDMTDIGRALRSTKLYQLDQLESESRAATPPAFSVHSIIPQGPKANVHLLSAATGDTIEISLGGSKGAALVAKSRKAAEAGLPVVSPRLLGDAS